VDHCFINFCWVLILLRVVRYLFTIFREVAGSYLKCSPLHLPHQVRPQNFCCTAYNFIEIFVDDLWPIYRDTWHLLKAMLEFILWSIVQRTRLTSSPFDDFKMFLEPATSTELTFRRIQPLILITLEEIEARIRDLGHQSSGSALARTSIR